MKRILALVLVLCLLTSCGGMLEREHTVLSPHAENPPALGGEAYRVETYPALCSALENYVEAGMEKGLLRFPTTYAGNLTVDLDRAKRQLMEEEPLWAYALEDMAFHIARIISYYEVELTFSYRVAPEELPALPRAEDLRALKTMLTQALDSFEPKLTVLLSNCPEGGGELFADCLAQVLDEHPAYTAGSPVLTVEQYPETGSRRVAALTLTYAGSVPYLRQSRDRMLATAQRVAEEAESTGEGVFLALRRRCAFRPEGGATPFAALTYGEANSEGLALTYKLLCDLKGISCQVVRTADKCYVRLEGGPNPLYLDVTAEQYAPGTEIPIPAPGEQNEAGPEAPPEEENT